MEDGDEVKDDGSQLQDGTALSTDQIWQENNSNMASEGAIVESNARIEEAPLSIISDDAASSPIARMDDTPSSYISVDTTPSLYDQKGTDSSLQFNSVLLDTTSSQHVYEEAALSPNAHAINPLDASIERTLLQELQDELFDRSYGGEPDVSHNNDTYLNKERNYNRIIGNTQSTIRCISSIPPCNNNIGQGETYKSNPEDSKINPEDSNSQPGENLKRNNMNRNKFSNDREKNCVKKRNNDENKKKNQNNNNKVGDIPAFTSFNVQRRSQDNRQKSSLQPRRNTNSSVQGRNAVAPEGSQQEHQQPQTPQQQIPQPRIKTPPQKYQEMKHSLRSTTAAAARSGESVEGNAPVLDLNRHGKRLGISLFLCHIIILAKISGAIYVCSNIDSSKLHWSWMPTSVFALNGICLVLEAIVVVQGVLLICLKLQDAGPIASMLWHRLLAGCLSFVTTILLSIIFLLLIISTVFEVLIYIELINKSQINN